MWAHDRNSERLLDGIPRNSDAILRFYACGFGGGIVADRVAAPWP